MRLFTQLTIEPVMLSSWLAFKEKMRPLLLRHKVCQLSALKTTLAARKGHRLSCTLCESQR